MINGQSNQRWVISYKQIGLIILTFLLGLITALLITNAQTGTPSTFTTTELVGFVLSVILSGASIVLAVAAISLGKYSEFAIMRRSDESIRLQNEVFVKTTDALQRIESSTGVTEKRIEDIISGRVGDISHQIAEMATGGGKYRFRDPRDLEENIRKSLISTIKEERAGTVDEEIRDKKRKRILEERQKYQKAHENSLYTIANKEGVSIEKVGHGNSSETGEELFDGIYAKNGRRFAVSTFKYNTGISILTEFAGNAASEIAKQSVSSVYMVVFRTEDTEDTEKAITEHLSTIKEALSSNIHVVFCDYSDVVEKMNEITL